MAECIRIRKTRRNGVFGDSIVINLRIAMNIHFPRRPLRIILTFTVTAIFATFAWRHFDFRHPGENGIFPFFCFSIACFCARECLRYARYLIHPETLRLDSDGIHVRHNDAAAWQVLHLPWAAISRTPGATVTGGCIWSG